MTKRARLAAAIASELQQPERASPPTDTAELLASVRAIVAKYLIVPGAHYLDVIALWVLHTHAIQAFDTTPRLLAKSAEKESGKTRLLEVLDLLVALPLSIINVTIAAVFRLLATEQATVLFDEVDAIFGPKAAREHEDLRALLNSGYRRGATVARVTGDGKKMKVERFPVFAATALAGIGNLPDTIENRSIVIPMRRRAPDEALQPFRLREVRAETEDLRLALIAWGVAAEAELTAARPLMPEGLVDRAADVWEPLLAIADLAGGDWPQRARNAAQAIVANRVADDLSWGVRLLGDIREVFVVDDRMSSDALVIALNSLPEAPWGGLHDRHGLNQSDLAKRLKPYGIEPKTVRLAPKSTPRGYLREQFVDAWKRYLRVDEPDPTTPSPERAGDESPIDLTADLGLAAFGFGPDRDVPNGHARARVVGVNSHFELIGEDGTQLTMQPFVGPLQAASYAKRQGWEVTEA